MQTYAKPKIYIFPSSSPANKSASLTLGSAFWRSLQQHLSCIQLNLEGNNFLFSSLDVKDARNFLETQFKQRNLSGETGVEDESFHLTTYIPLALTGKNWNQTRKNTLNSFL